jgi:hypothetical protein
VDYKVNPMPEMVSQTFWIGSVLHLPIIDPTCGRYCLKGLLKYHWEIHFKQRLVDIALPKPKSRVKDWIAYDPFDDFQLSGELLSESSDLPTTADGWIARLKARGPIVLSGKLGKASVPHFILLVGVNSDAPAKFYFKDPLVGDKLGEEAFATMQPRIETPMVYGRLDIAAALVKHPELAPKLGVDLP